MNSDVWCDPRAGEIAATARAFGAIPALRSHPNVGTILGDLAAAGILDNADGAWRHTGDNDPTLSEPVNVEGPATMIRLAFDRYVRLVRVQHFRNEPVRPNQAETIHRGLFRYGFDSHTLHSSERPLFESPLLQPRTDRAYWPVPAGPMWLGYRGPVDYRLADPVWTCTDSGVPHSLDGPALQWADNTSLYAVHGLPVPGWVVTGDGFSWPRFAPLASRLLNRDTLVPVTVLVDHHGGWDAVRHAWPSLNRQARGVYTTLIEALY